MPEMIPGKTTSMSDCRSADPPSPFIDAWSRRLRPGWTSVPRALDLACGRGRHAAVLARDGCRVFAVDVSLGAVREARDRVERQGGALLGWAADLTATHLPPRFFDLVVVTRYLQRDLFPAIRDAVAPNGVVLYETFTNQQRALGWGPQSPDHLLARGELRSHFEMLDVLFYEEVDAPEAVARIVARVR
ncbi:MAG TPA: class I SAM-dependent methyltransferase [Vicinamibacterales bacterium]|jgi:SAM-dependent methyltransferase|nr:class I SAM-dependent methyltransferase [Vicinamibacterales bacterium]